MPTSTPMYWEDYYEMVTAALRGGPSVDKTLFTQMLNDVRMFREEERQYKMFRKQDQSQTWNAGDTWQTPKIVPSDFVSYLEEQPMLLWDGNINPNSLIEPVGLLPFETLLWYNTDTYSAAVDYNSNQFYMAGTTQQTFKIVQYYVADAGDILPASNGVSYTWQKVPPRFHKMLAWDVLALFRLGVSYDDLAARNADSNGMQAERTASAMKKWDSRLNRTDIRNTDYFPQDIPNFVNRKINLQGQ